MRQTILSEIKRLADTNGGRPPGSQLFRTETGIGEAKWRGKYWARWGDALAEAGYEANEWTAKLDSAELIRKIAELARDRGALSTDAELNLWRRTDPSVPSPKTLRTHFNSRATLVEAVRSYCFATSGFEAVLAALPAPNTAVRSGAPVREEGWVYLLKSGQHYKIGRSSEIEARLKKISIALPETTTLVHAIKTDDPPGIEAYWHRRFADSRVNGEWFRLASVDVAAFTRRKFQ